MLDRIEAQLRNEDAADRKAAVLAKAVEEAGRNVRDVATAHQVRREELWIKVATAVADNDEAEDQLGRQASKAVQDFDAFFSSKDSP